MNYRAETFNEWVERTTKGILYGSDWPIVLHDKDRCDALASRGVKIMETKHIPGTFIATRPTE